jgi:hypothetical protein
MDQGRIPAYRFGPVIRLQQRDVEDYITSCRGVPGTLGHLHNIPADQSDLGQPGGPVDEAGAGDDL